MAKSENQYTFKFLREESVDNDLFEDKTHERIAKSILKLILSEEKSVSIGLEGPWGSGKSTIISILKRKIQENDSTISLILFDAWAHEGDPLRRIFLETLINEIKPYIKVSYWEELNELREKIAHRKKTKTIKTTRTTTALGKWLSIALFFVPIGVAFLSSVNYSNLSFIGNPYWAFIVGITSSSAPLLVALVNFIRICKNKDLRKRGIFNSKNWAFLEDIADEDITQEFSEEDERSSIEFEQYFDQIMEIVFKNSKIKKLILVIDNLDRIDVHDALKIWSTLQTFLSQRTQTWNKKEWFDRIWIIVPYDAEGLSRLWEKRTDNTNQNLSKPFFDKCFQLKIEVPKPIFSGWETFARQMMEDALEGWKISDKDELIRVLRITRKNLTDIPTPREIKNYINKVGFLASQWGHIISISTIAYYVCWRELANESVEEIKSKLVKNELIDPKHKHLMPEKCIVELAGLVFGVAPEKGVQLLLESEIIRALKNGDGKILKRLYEDHSDGFWHIFNHFIEHNDIEFSLALTSAKAIYDSIWKDNSEKCNVFVNRVSKIDVSDAPKEIEWSKQEIDEYICLIKICQEEKDFIQNVYQHLINCLRNSINKKGDNIEWEKVISSLSKVVNTLSEVKQSIHKETIERLSLSNLIFLAKTSIDLGYEAYKWIAPPENIVEEISKAIVPGQTLQEGLTEAIQYSIDAGIENGWDTVLIQCQQYINWNDGNYSKQSDEIFKIINVITFKLHSVDKVNQITFNIVISGQYHNLFWQRRTQILIYGALLCGYVFKEELQAKNIPTVGNSTSGFNEIKKFWVNSNTDTAKQVLEEMKKYNLWSFIWELCNDEKNRLVKDIISIAFNDKDAVELFHVKPALARLKKFSNLLGNIDSGDDKILKLIEKFTEYADLEDEIIGADDLDLVEYDYELYLIISQTENHQVITKTADELRNINKEAWFESLIENTYLTSLALEVKNKQKEFFLENNFTDAIIEFVKSDSEYSDWQKENWHDLISLMGKSFQKYYKDKITEYLYNNLKTISLDTFNLNKEYFNYQEVLNKTKTIQDAIDTILKEKNIERLQLLNEILSRGKFKPEKYFSEVIRKPLQELYSEAESKEKKSVIESLVRKLSIDILKSGDEEIKEGE